MAKFDFGKLKEKINQSADAVKKTAQESVPDKMKNLSQAADTFVKSAQENLPEKMKNVDVAASMKEMAKKSSEALAKFKKESEDTDRTVKEVLAAADSYPKALTIEDTLKVIYYLIAADRTITQEEMNLFDSIGKDLDPLYDEHRPELLTYCQSEIEKADEDEDLDIHIHDCIGNAIRHSIETGNGTVNSKLLLWNLLSIAYSDGTCSEEERKLVRYAGRQLEVDKAVVSEMESTVNTLLAVEKEIEFVKSSDRKYSEVEAIVNELTDRKTVIMKGVHALITD